MEGKPPKDEIRQALGKIGDQDIISLQKPDQKAFLQELGVLKGVNPNTNPEVLRDVLGNILENERLEKEEKKQ